MDIIFGEGTSAQRQQWHEIQARAKSLPADYYATYKKMQKYIFKRGAGTGRIFLELLDLLELGVLEEQRIEQVVGPDIASFCEELLEEPMVDWKDKYRQELNQYFAGRK